MMVVISQVLHRWYKICAKKNRTSHGN